MEKDLLEKVQKRILEFEKEFNLKLKLLQPFDSKYRVFAIEGHKAKLEAIHDELLFLFEDIKIKHNSTFYSVFMTEEPKYIMHIYEY